MAMKSKGKQSLLGGNKKFGLYLYFNFPMHCKQYHRIGTAVARFTLFKQIPFSNNSQYSIKYSDWFWATLIQLPNPERLAACSIIRSLCWDWFALLSFRILWVGSRLVPSNYLLKFIDTILLLYIETVVGKIHIPGQCVAWFDCMNHPGFSLIFI